MKVYLHVNYCEGPGKLDTLFDIAQRNTYDGVELRYKYRFPDLNQEQYLQKVLALKNRYPALDIYFQGMVNLYRDDTDAINRELDEYIAFLAWSQRHLGTRIMNFSTGTLIRPGGNYNDFDQNGSGMATEADYGKTARSLRRIGDAATALGMRVALESHNCCLHDLAASCRKLMDATAHDAIGINYDHSNILINKKGETIEQVFALIGDKIYHTHLKNMLVVKDVYLVTHLDQGQINTCEILRRLRDGGYRGELCVEYPWPGDGVIAAKRDKEYIDYLQDFLGTR
jgi:sugar phosphate isomerase/epimerase